MRDLCALILLALISVSAYQHGEYLYLPLGYLALYLLALYIRERRERERDLFLHQLKSHRRELRAGGTIAVDHTLLNYQTILVTFRVNVGGIISSVVIPSPYRHLSSHSQAEPFLYSLCSVLSGWWSIPMGPIETLIIVLHNLSHHERSTVRELIDQPQKTSPRPRQTTLQVHGRPRTPSVQSGR